MYTLYVKLTRDIDKFLLNLRIKGVECDLVVFYDFDK